MEKVKTYGNERREEIIKTIGIKQKLVALQALESGQTASDVNKSFNVARIYS